MFVGKHIPEYPLNQYIKCYWVLKGDGKMTREINPSSSISVCYRISGKSSFCLLASDFWKGQPRSVDFLLKRLREAQATASDVIVGPHRHLMMEYSDDGMFTFGIEFKTGLRKVFFGTGITNLSNNVVPLTDNAAILSSIKNIVSSCPENRLIDEVNNYLTENLLPYMQNRDCNTELPAIMDEISADPFAVDIAALAEGARMSVRSFQRYFMQFTGLALRDFIGIRKIDKVLGVMMENRGCSLREILEISGYYDYSHINRDFKIVGGLPSSLVFKNVRDNFTKTECTSFARDLHEDTCAVNLMV